MSDPTIGVLALQGAFVRHIEVFQRIGVEAVQVREPDNLTGIDALVIPGGESTTISKMMVRWALIEPLKHLISNGLPVFGTCAGLILLADHLVNWDELPRLGGLDITVARNAYGRQIDSFEAPLVVEGIPDLADSPFNGVFIRAPRIVPESTGADVEVLGTFEGAPILVRQGNLLGAAFHPELTGDDRLHRWFINVLVSESMAQPTIPR